jgi:hypothetical protein
MGICFIIDGAVSGVIKRRHDVTFRVLFTFVSFDRCVELLLGDLLSRNPGVE